MCYYYTSLSNSAYSVTLHLKSAIVGIFTPWKLSNVTNQGSPPYNQLLNIYQHTLYGGDREILYYTEGSTEYYEKKREINLVGTGG